MAWNLCGIWYGTVVVVVNMNNKKSGSSLSVVSWAQSVKRATRKEADSDPCVGFLVRNLCHKLEGGRLVFDRGVERREGEGGSPNQVRFEPFFFSEQ